jgi:type II secretory pathway pseudopilin PulG
MNRAKRSQGFTLIELMLAMAFIALLLLAVALTIIQIANIYNRGLLLKEVNQVSRSIGDELDRSMRSASIFSLDPSANRYVSNTAGGRLCLGQYTFVWNYRAAVVANNPDLNRYTNNQLMTFAKVPDPGSSLCVRGVNPPYRYPNVNPSGATELVPNGDHTLSIHAVTVASASTAEDILSSQRLYRISFVLGTSDLNALDSTRTACKPPSQPGADLTYCSVQQFTLVLRVVNGVN